MYRGERLSEGLLTVVIRSGVWLPPFAACWIHTPHVDFTGASSSGACWLDQSEGDPVVAFQKRQRVVEKFLAAARVSSVTSLIKSEGRLCAQLSLFFTRLQPSIVLLFHLRLVPANSMYVS